jgi:pentatricopeptide repeat protein
VVYNALIGAWANAGVPEKAELILRGMESETSGGVKPDTITYLAVMGGWSRSRHPTGEDRMQALYDEMNDKYKAGDESVKPNAAIFDTMLSTWLRTGRKDGLLKAEAVFNDMHARYRSGEAEFKPLVDKYGSLFKAHPVKS